MHKSMKTGIALMALSLALSAGVYGADMAFAKEDTAENRLTDNPGGSGFGSSNGATDSQGEYEMRELSGEDGYFETSNSGRTLEKYVGNSESVVIPNGITTIVSNAFSDAPAVKNVTLPATLTSLRQDAFRGNDSITGFTSNSGNFPTYGDCIYKDGGKTLYVVPEGKQGTVVVPSSATAIQNGSLEGCASVEALSIPASVQKISGVVETHTVSQIEGENGSAAEIYAKSNGISFIPSKVADSFSVIEASAASPILSSEDLVTAPIHNDAGDDEVMYYINGTTNQGELYRGSGSSYGEDEDDDGERDEDDWYYDEEYDVPDDAAVSEAAPVQEAAPAAPVPLSPSSPSTPPMNGSGAYVPSGSVPAHAPDQTPKTADGDIDPRYVFCIGLFLSGMAILFFGFKKTYLVVVKRQKKEEVDELD